MHLPLELTDRIHALGPDETGSHSTSELLVESPFLQGTGVVETTELLRYPALTRPREECDRQAALSRVSSRPGWPVTGSGGQT